MNILVINAGSSSLKYQLLNMENETLLAKGGVERVEDYLHALDQVRQELTEPVHAVGHRVVHGGESLKESVVITNDVLAEIKRCSEFAPLHNPVNIACIRAATEIFGADVPNVAVFDTAFHTTMPQHAYMFALPYEYYEQYGIRRYGFHGTSHQFVSQRCAELMDKPKEHLKLITCHLGQGCSITAIDGGKVIDTSMGFTPLDGFMMGTRSGGVDPSAVLYLMEREGWSPAQASDVLNKQSGALGISGVSNDERDIKVAADQGNTRAQLSREMLRYQIRKFVGAYAAALNGVDAIVFTGGIGENNWDTREAICEGLTYLGMNIDTNINAVRVREGELRISTDDSRVQVWVIPTNEELLIARETAQLL
ncbi:MAG: acetate kinase [Oscillospiraceae bacterium]|nr:acetate kinase [Oscillospiraceae bacterium]